MKTIFTFFFLLCLVIMALVLQDAFSGTMGLFQIRLFLIPIIFCFGALTLSFSVALFFGIIVGLLEGLMTLSFHAHHADIGLVWFICAFAIWVVLLQGATELTDGIRWELHALGSALFTAFFLAGEWILLSWHRGSFSITLTTLTLIAIPSAISLLLAPLLYYSLQFLLPPSRNRLNA